MSNSDYFAIGLCIGFAILLILMLVCVGCYYETKQGVPAED